MRYEELPPIARADYRAASQSVTPAIRAEAILRLALHDDDVAFVDSACQRTLDDYDWTVRRAAILAVGHMARLHGTVDPATVSAIRRMTDDPDVGACAIDVLDDIDIFT